MVHASNGFEQPPWDVFEQFCTLIIAFAIFRSTIISIHFEDQKVMKMIITSWLRHANDGYISVRESPSFTVVTHEMLRGKRQNTASRVGLRYTNDGNTSVGESPWLTLSYEMPRKRSEHAISLSMDLRGDTTRPRERR